MPRRLLLLGCTLLTSGCLWPVRENTDATVANYRKVKAELAKTLKTNLEAPILKSKLLDGANFACHCGGSHRTSR